jgi:hypothetical protein
MANTSDSPLMKIFDDFRGTNPPKAIDKNLSYN